jgi:hypothetical protein
MADELNRRLSTRGASGARAAPVATLAAWTCAPRPVAVASVAWRDRSSSVAWD